MPGVPATIHGGYKGRNFDLEIPLNYVIPGYLTVVEQASNILQNEQEMHLVVESWRILLSRFPAHTVTNRELMVLLNFIKSHNLSGFDFGEPTNKGIHSVQIRRVHSGKLNYDFSGYIPDK